MHRSKSTPVASPAFKKILLCTAATYFSLGAAAGARAQAAPAGDQAASPIAMQNSDQGPGSIGSPDATIAHHGI